MAVDSPLLQHALVAAPGGSPSRWMVVLHGVFGSGANWRLFTRRLASQRPDWGYVLVDLRGHGQSKSGSTPHTVAAAAADVLALELALGKPFGGALGHSLGGKIMLEMLEQRAAAGSARVEHAFLLDSSPSAGDPRGASVAVLELLESMPSVLPSRETFVQLVRDAGHSSGIAEWLAMNVRPGQDGYRFRVDLAVVRPLLEDYFRRDLWPVVERLDGTANLHVVLGGRSESMAPGDRERFEDLAVRNAALTVDVLTEAGHWLHADDPEGLAHMVLDRLSS